MLCRGPEKEVGVKTGGGVCVQRGWRNGGRKQLWPHLIVPPHTHLLLSAPRQRSERNAQFENRKAPLNMRAFGLSVSCCNKNVCQVCEPRFLCVPSPLSTHAHTFTPRDFALESTAAKIRTLWTALRMPKHNCAIKPSMARTWISVLHSGIRRPVRVTLWYKAWAEVMLRLW